jgi:hypothetical protein
LALAQDLAEWAYLQTVLLQYVDDILLGGLLEDTASQATESLLNFLADWDHKVSREKIQLCQVQVTYLELVVTKGRSAFGNNRIQTILAFPLARTLKQLRTCFG